MSLQVAILAGGLATRLKAVTETTPKSLVEVAGKPFVLHQLELLRRSGVSRVVLCVGHLGEQIEAIVGDGTQLGLSVAYSFDGDVLLGTGGALKRALPLLDDRFLVLYGDSYLRCDYQAIGDWFAKSKRMGLMTVYRNDDRFDVSNVEFRDGRIHRYDKSTGATGLTHIDWGLGGLCSEAFADYDGLEKLDLATVYQSLLARNELAAFEVRERFYEIGSPTGLAETRQLLDAKELT